MSRVVPGGMASRARGRRGRPGPPGWAAGLLLAAVLGAPTAAAAPRALQAPPLLGTGPAAERRPGPAGADAAAVAAAAEARARAALAELRRRIAGSEARLGAFHKEEQGVLAVLEKMDEAAIALAGTVREARADLARAEAAWQEAERALATVRAADVATARALARHARAVARSRSAGPLAWLAGAQDLGDVLARMRAHRRSAEREATLLALRRRTARGLYEAEAETRARAQERAHARDVLTGRLRELAVEREARARLIARLRSDAAAEQQAAEELERAAWRLEERLAGLGATAAPPPEGPAFAALRGRLPRPVAAPLVQGFGRHVDARFRTATFHGGVGFAAGRGAPVRAVAAGEVRFAGWFQGYGRLVILDHGDEYYTVSGHLSELAVTVGETVASGHVLGRVGGTGSLAGPRLYFEIRHGREALDPARWLADAPGLD